MADNLYQKKVPMITCPKTFCGCGMCITKGEDISDMFYEHTREVEYYDIPIKTSNFETDITTKKVFESHDQQ